MFSEACVLTRMSGAFEKSEVMYLEYIAIVQTIEQGDVQLMENSNLPEEPYLSIERKRQLDDVFRDYMMLVDFAGFCSLFSRRRYAIKNTGFLNNNRISNRISIVSTDT